MKRLIERYAALAACGILVAAILVAAHLPASCTLTPAQRARVDAVLPIVLPLSQAALTYAESTGNLPPGSSVTISQGLAVIASDASPTEKVVQLKTLGLDAALREGVLQEGDRAIVDAAGTALVLLLEAQEKPAPEPATFPPPTSP